MPGKRSSQGSSLLGTSMQHCALYWIFLVVSGLLLLSIDVYFSGKQECLMGSCLIYAH